MGKCGDCKGYKCLMKPRDGKPYGTEWIWCNRVQREIHYKEASCVLLLSHPIEEIMKYDVNIDIEELKRDREKEQRKQEKMLKKYEEIKSRYEGRKLTKAEKKQALLELIKHDIPISWLCRFVKISNASLPNLLQYDESSDGKKKKGFSKIKEQQILPLLKENLPILEIYKKTGCAYQTIKNVAKRNGYKIVVEDKYSRAKELSCHMCEIQELREKQGLSFSKIRDELAKRYNLNTSEQYVAHLYRKYKEG